MMPHVNGALSGKLPAAQQPKDPIRDSESCVADKQCRRAIGLNQLDYAFTVVLACVDIYGVHSRKCETGQRITAPCKAIESSRLGWSCVSTSDSRSSGAQAVSPNAPELPSIRGRCRSTRTVRKSSRSEYSRSGCCRRQHLRDDRSSRLSLMTILSSMPLGTANTSKG